MYYFRVAQSMSKTWRYLIVGGIVLGIVAIYFVAQIPNQPQPSKSTAKNSEISSKTESANSLNSANQAQNPVKTESLKPVVSVSAPIITSRMLFMGDVFWGRSINQWSQDSNLKYAYPFSGLSGFERQKYDAWIANLECPITDQIRSPAQQEAGLKFTCLPEYLPEAKKYFDIFSQANNHTDNMQEFDGLNSTRKFLENAGFQYFGSFDNHDIKDACEVISMPATATQNSITKTQIPVAMCGYNNVFSLPNKADLDAIKVYSKYFPTIIMPHQGQEYVSKADKYKVSMYRQMIDEGADLVVGAHPHAVQNTEVYNGKLIVYSIGNFIFDQLGNTTVNRGAAIDVTLKLGQADPNDVQSSQNLQNWLKLADSCKTYKDDCLKQAQAQKLVKPAFSLTFEIIASENDQKITRKGDDKTTQDVLKLTNWDDSMAALGQK